MAFSFLRLWRNSQRAGGISQVYDKSQVQKQKDSKQQSVFEDDDDDEDEEMIYALPFPSQVNRPLGNNRMSRTWNQNDFASARRSCVYDGFATASGNPQERRPAAFGEQQNNHLKLSLEIQSQALRHYVDIQNKHVSGHMKGCTVLKALRIKDRKKVALKVWDKKQLSSYDTGRVTQELDILRKVQSIPNVVKLDQHYVDKRCEVGEMELCSGGTLIEYMCFNGGKVTEQVALSMFVKPLVECLCELHNLRIIHRDIRPEHIMLTKSNDMRLIDFGHAIDINVDVANYYCGSLEYMAPEVQDKMQPGDVFHKVLQEGMDERELPQYNSKADIWSLGVVIYEMLTGSQPFIADTTDDMQQAIDNAFKSIVDPATSPSSSHSTSAASLPHFLARLAARVSHDAVSFLQACLQVDPAQRASAEQLRKHPWLQKASIVQKRTSIELKQRSGHRLSLTV